MRDLHADLGMKVYALLFVPQSLLKIPKRGPFNITTARRYEAMATATPDGSRSSDTESAGSVHRPTRPWWTSFSTG